MRINQKLKQKLKSGFTIVEMLVTLSILVIITSAILANYPKFSQRLSLERTTQEIALSLREAKTYALAVREFGIGTDVFPGYGVHFDINTPKQYILFADINESSQYDAGEEVDEFFITAHASVKEFCLGLKTAPPGDCATYQKLDIAYFRPDPNITITGIDSFGAPNSSFADVGVIIETPDGDQNTIVIWTTGQVSVE